MICPYCEMEQSICNDSRQCGEVRNRRYRCLNCGATYHTREMLLMKSRTRRSAEQDLQAAKAELAHLKSIFTAAALECDAFLNGGSQ